MEISRLEQLQPEIRERFIHRVFTPREQEDAHGSFASLAGRFAAKEAVSKALGCGIGQVGWRDIEIQRSASGEPQLILHGKAQQLSDQMGFTDWSISISHSQTHAVAVAVALAERGVAERQDP